MGDAPDYESAILDALHRREQGMTTEELYDFVSGQYSELCQSSHPCVHNGVDYGQPEWKHLLRNAQQILKRQGRIELSNQVWKLLS